MRSAESNGFVADGRERALDGIRAQVEEEYSQRLRVASDDEAARLRVELQAVLEARMRRLAPPDALY